MQAMAIYRLGNTGRQVVQCLCSINEKGLGRLAYNENEWLLSVESS